MTVSQHSIRAHLSLACRKLASPANDVDHLGELVRRAVLRPASLMAVVRLPRAPGMLAATVFDVYHSVLLMRRAKLSSLPVQAVGGLPGALVKLAPEGNTFVHPLVDEVSGHRSSVDEVSGHRSLVNATSLIG